MRNTTKAILCLLFMSFAYISCTDVNEPDDPDTPEQEKTYKRKDGIAYVFDSAVIPEIHITVPLKQWNQLLDYYDASAKTKEYVMCDVLFDKAGEQTMIDSVGLRIRGNTSRRRPEGSKGQHHNANSTDWNHFHMGLNFHKYTESDGHTLHGLRKMNLKWFNNDPSYVRELYCYDLFKRYGIWTAMQDQYCRLWIKVEGDSKETYYGVYEMMEPIDGNYVKVRDDEDTFGNHDGFLWKCTYGSTLTSTDDNKFGAEEGKDFVYELKTNTEQFDAAKAQFQDFILKVKGKTGESFHTWIQQVCDVEMLLKTYAVNVAVSMWDDYWNNCNNWYIYFNSQDKYNYKFWFIPFDYDNTLGTATNCGAQSDPGRQNPLSWGSESNPLIYKILQYDDFKAIYVKALKELTDSKNDYFYHEKSRERIRKWQSQISSYVSNDTGEDMVIKDSPASWGNHPEYRLLESGSKNFFEVKESVINAL